MREAIQKIAVGPDRGRDMSRDEAYSVMKGILDGQSDEIQVAVLLIALRMKRESIDEFLGLFDAMQESVATVSSNVEELFTLADPFDGYVRTASMTPFIPAALSACGYHSLIHGVETVGPKHGITAHKVYKLAGIDVDMSVIEAERCISEFGWAYVDQSNYAKSLFSLNDLRDRIVKRTAITTLERLLMPVRAQQTHLVLCYVHKAYPSIYARIASSAGYDSTLLLKGVEGGLAPALNKPLRQFFIRGQLPEDVDQQKQLFESAELFTSSNAAYSLNLENGFDSTQAVLECLETGLDVLKGKKNEARESLCLAVGQILFAHKKNQTLIEAVKKVESKLDDGSVLEHFTVLI